MAASHAPHHRGWGSCVGYEVLTFILSMLASIFSCSTSFLACAMLAVLLLAIGMLGRLFRYTRKENRRKDALGNSWAAKCAGSSHPGASKVWLWVRPGSASPLHPQSGTESDCRQTRRWGVCFQIPVPSTSLSCPVPPSPCSIPLDFHPFFREAQWNTMFTKSVRIRCTAELRKQVSNLMKWVQNSKGDNMHYYWF